MSSDRRLEYERSPRLEEEQAPDATESDDESAETDERDDSGGGQPTATVAPWTGGFGIGVSAFAVVFAVTYQLTATMDAVGLFGASDDEPGRLVLTGLTNLADHGATIEVGGEPIGSGVGPLNVGFTSHISALIPAVVLLTAGFLLVRYVRLETRRDAAFAVSSLVASYVVVTLVSAFFARWRPEGEMESVAVATDLGTAVTVTRTALVFTVVGAAVAGFPRLAETLASDRADRD